MVRGGLMLGKQYEETEQERRKCKEEKILTMRFPAVLFGTVSKYPKETIVESTGNRNVTFELKHDKKGITGIHYPERSGKVKCTSWDDKVVDVALDLEFGDYVLCAGEWAIRKYIKPQKSKHYKKEFKDDWHELTVRWIMPMDLIWELNRFCNTNDYHDFMERWKNGDADPMLFEE